MRRYLLRWTCVFAVLTIFALPVPAQEAQENSDLPVPNSSESTGEFVEAGSWTLVVIPDTQNYVKKAENQGILELMTAWINKNRNSENIRAAVQVGDLVDRNNITTLKEVKHTNQLSPQQWTAVRHAMDRLSKVPTVIVPGNHDFGSGPETSGNRECHLGTYFPVDWNPANVDHLVSVCPNFYGEETLESAAYEFPFFEDRKMLIVGLEFAPSDRVLDWARELISREEYRDAYVILVTHSYINSKGKRIEKEGYKVEDANYGEAMWQKLIYPSDNIRMVICGHIGAPTLKGSTACTCDSNHNGERVWQVLFDTQFMGEGNGGDGWLRLLRFSGDGRKVRVQAVSPLFDISPETRDAAWDHSPLNEYEFDL